MCNGAARRGAIAGFAPLFPPHSRPSQSSDRKQQMFMNLFSRSSGQHGAEL
jgi:hypothetical protein